MRRTLALFAAVTLCATPSFAQRRRPARPDASATITDAGTASPTADPWSGFDALLRAVVRPTGVDYAALRARIEELRALHAWLATHGPTTTPEAFRSANARLAYWLNAYNAAVLLGVAEAPASMGNVLAYLPDNGFFRRTRRRVDGRDLSLDDIENREVRAVFHDARVHFALNCAARSCPPLRAGAYHADRVSAELDEQARRYFAGDRVTLDDAAHTVRVVQLFEWFRDDFAARVPGHTPSTVQGPLGFVHTFAPEALRRRIEATCGADGARCTLTFEPYDWTLNRAR